MPQGTDKFRSKVRLWLQWRTKSSPSWKDKPCENIFFVCCSKLFLLSHRKLNIDQPWSQSLWCVFFQMLKWKVVWVIRLCERWPGSRFCARRGCRGDRLLFLFLISNFQLLSFPLGGWWTTRVGWSSPPSLGSVLFWSSLLLLSLVKEELCRFLEVKFTNPLIGCTYVRSDLDNKWMKWHVGKRDISRQEYIYV